MKAPGIHRVWARQCFVWGVAVTLGIGLWAADPTAFRSGLDLSTRDFTPLDRTNLIGWYERTLGYVPKSRPVTPGEVAATLFKGLGLDPHRELPGPQNRPLPLVEFSLQPIKELF